MKIGAVVLCRYNSSRLPGKILLPVGGKSILCNIVARIESTNLPVVIATSNENSDDPIFQHCQEYGIKCFRGSLNDVASRFLECAESENLTYAIRINGDNLFVNSEVISILSSRAEQTKEEFLTNVPGRTYPPGASVEVVNVASYRRLIQAFDDHHREHVTLYLYQNPDCCKQYVYLNPNKEKMQGLSIAIDTIEDYERALKVAEVLAGPLENYTLCSIAKVYKQL